MQIQKSFKGQSPYGKLYLVATPIGNLDDMTFRAIQTLKEVDWIAAEDTRNTGLLLKHFDISTKQISFHEHNAKEKIPDLIGFLKAGQSIAQVSDAGLPSISDPGHDLVKAAIEEEIAVVTVPGASAGISALIASGLAPQPHIFQDEEDLFVEIQTRIQQGVKKNQAIKEVAKIYQWNKSQLYGAYHDWEEND